MIHATTTSFMSGRFVLANSLPKGRKCSDYSDVESRTNFVGNRTHLEPDILVPLIIPYDFKAIINQREVVRVG
ncbi:MAG: hypothetical protein CMH85_18390 [Novosphingobium sp.]|jgi:hypothetical protein|nr:hypothetical protein [Novosphingobium sp.]